MKNNFYGTKYKKTVRHLVVVLIMNFHNRAHKKKINQISKMNNSKVIRLMRISK